jgi:pyruvate/2-oxoglutarate dehydrogenase complex dihydrolipoamide acyltransferase (E2) component
MDILDASLEHHKGGTRPQNAAKHELLTLFQAVGALTGKIQSKAKDAVKFEAFLEKCVMGPRPRILKEICDFAKGFAAFEEHAAEIREADKKRVEEEARAAEEKARKAAEKALRAAEKAKKEEEAAKAAAAKKGVDAPMPMHVHVHTTGGGGVEITVGGVVVRPIATEGQSPLARAPAPHKKTPIPKQLKNKIWRKYMGKDRGCAKCPCCYDNEIYMDTFVAGHIVSEKDKGTVTEDNLIPICSGCNLSMTTRNMYEYCMTHYKRGLIFPDPTDKPKEKHE